MRDLDWDDLRVFLSIAETGSLTAAARRLGLTHTTVGRRLRGLESVLGGELFERLPNQLVLTPLGREMVEVGEAMRHAADAIARRASARNAARRQPVRITATSSVALFVARHLGRLIAHCPGAEIALLPSRERLSLARREADIAIRMRRLPEEGDLVGRRLGRLAFGLYAATMAPPLCFIGLDLPARPGSQADWVERAAANGRIVVRLGDLRLRLEAARASLGVALLPCHIGDADPLLARHAPPPAELAEDVFLVVHGDLRGSPPVRSVSEALVELFRQEAAALAGDA